MEIRKKKRAAEAQQGTHILGSLKSRQKEKLSNIRCSWKAGSDFWNALPIEGVTFLPVSSSYRNSDSKCNQWKFQRWFRVELHSHQAVLTVCDTDQALSPKILIEVHNTRLKNHILPKLQLGRVHDCDKTASLAPRTPNKPRLCSKKKKQQNSLQHGIGAAWKEFKHAGHREEIKKRNVWGVASRPNHHQAKAAHCWPLGAICIPRSNWWELKHCDQQISPQEIFNNTFPRKNT